MRLAVLIASVLFATCPPFADAPANAKEAADVRARAEDDIREATFRYQFERDGGADVYFLSVGLDQADPSDAFMRRFAGHKPAVRKASQSTGAGGGVRDKLTGERGVRFRVEAVKWVSETEVEVLGGYYAGGTSAAGSTYRLKRAAVGWVVESTKLHWMS